MGAATYLFVGRLRVFAEEAQRDVALESIFPLIGVGFYSLFIAHSTCPRRVESLNALECKIISVIVVTWRWLERFIQRDDDLDVLSRAAAVKEQTIARSAEV